MNTIQFIENYCLIYNLITNKYINIKLKDYQIEFIKRYEQEKRKTGRDKDGRKNNGCKTYTIIRGRC